MHLFLKNGLDLADKTNATVALYALQSGDYFAANLRIENACFVFNAVCSGVTIENIALMMPGFHNVENALGATAACLQAGLSAYEIREGLNAYKVVKRRFEYVVKTDAHVYIDDYAHHPTEIEAFLSSIKALYPNKKLTCVFQPHLFTRTRDFQEGFAQSLSIADDLILLDIYPARELPIEGITSNIIFDKVTTENKTLCTKNEVLNLLKTKNPELVVTVGAGDIDTLINPIREWLEAN